MGYHDREGSEQVLPSDLFSTDIGKAWEADEVRRLWPSARGELLGFANALDRSGSGITADQLRMAVLLADKQFDLMVAQAGGGL
jgi:hypothetical protein